MHFLLGIRIFSNTLSILEKKLSIFGAACKISVAGDHSAGQDLQKSAGKTHFVKMVCGGC